MKNAVVVRLMGGLGNQLFQLAHALNLKETHGCEVALDVSWFRHVPAGQSPRSMELTEEIGLRVIALPHWIWSSHLPFAQWENFESPPVRRSGTRTLQAGYWQSWDSVDAVSHLMQSQLTAMMTARGIEVGAGRDYVAAHLRLGDYLDARTGARHGSSTVERTLSVANEMRRDLGASEIRLFTDSPDRLAGKLPSDVAIASETTAFAALGAMANGRGLVTGNSTLSWWAGMLGRWVHEDSWPVMYPTPWLRLPSPLDRSLAVPGWIPYERLQDGHL